MPTATQPAAEPQPSPADRPAGRFRGRLRPDGFLIAIIVAAVVATLLPARGGFVPVIEWTSKAMVAALFFFYGVRLEGREALAGLKHWRLHSVILCFTYLVFPAVGLSLGLLVPQLISPELYRGILWICIVPATVQSAINFTSIAGGNVAAAIVSASLSNLLGVVLTPLLAMALLRTQGLRLSAASVLDIALQVLVPFLLGQLLRPRVIGFVQSHPRLKYLDQATIVVVVYIAFSAGVRNGIWQSTRWSDLAVILVVTLVILAFMLVATWQLAGWLGFDRRDQIAIQFAGTKKSLTTGVPMAAVLFPASMVGLVVLPLMVFHQAQLMACSVLAARYAAKDACWHQQVSHPRPAH